MFELLGKKINLGHAVSLSEVEFKEQFGSVYKSKINEAWGLIKKQQDASSSKSVEIDAKTETVGRFEKKRNKGVHTPIEPTESDLD